MDTNTEGSEHFSNNGREVEDHKLGEIVEVEFSRGLFEAECECSNPDGEAVGLVRFIGQDSKDVLEQHQDHLEKVATTSKGQQ